MNRTRIAAIIKKDLKEVGANRMAVVPMAVVPLLFATVLPGVLVGLGLSLPGGLGGSAAGAGLNGAELIQSMVALYPVPAAWSAFPDNILWVLTNYSFIPMLLIVPLMVSIVVAANAVTGEKERHTLETLLSTPMTPREFVAAKLLAAFIPACLIGLLSCALYLLTGNAVSLVLRGAWLIGAWHWLIVAFLIGPAVSLLGLGVTLMVSLKAKSFMEAQQGAALLVLPCLLLLLGQVSGVLVLSPLALAGMGLLLLAVDALLILRLAPRFEREKVVDIL